MFSFKIHTFFNSRIKFFPSSLLFRHRTYIYIRFSLSINYAISWIYIHDVHNPPMEQVLLASPQALYFPLKSLNFAILIFLSFIFSPIFYVSAKFIYTNILLHPLLASLHQWIDHISQRQNLLHYQYIVMMRTSVYPLDN